MSAGRILRVFLCVVLVQVSIGYGADRGGKDRVQGSERALRAGTEVSYDALAAWLAESGVMSDAIARAPRGDAASGPDPCAPSFNGCGPVDFLGVLANCPLGLLCFEGACNVHDVCYGTCGVPQLDCDFLFLVLMLGNCEDNFAPGTSDAELCNNLSFIYYILVRVFGDTFYSDAQAQACQCSPNLASTAQDCGDRGLVVEVPFVDADADLMPDDWEVRVGLDTTRMDSFDDADGDGLLNIAEYIQGTDPFDPDSDKNGVTDGTQAFSAQGGCCVAP